MDQSSAKAVKPVGGVHEWATRNANCSRGCSHNCLYCYGRAIATRFRRMEPEEWRDEIVLEREVRKTRHRVDGVVMFPTTHDITPTNLWACQVVLNGLLKVGNRVLIVSKPHLVCVQRLCRELSPYKSQILFRFTIGVMDEALRCFWEPNAPSFDERLACLRLAFEAGYQTSVSAEPLLEPWNVRQLVEAVRPFVTHSIWIGKANELRRRTAWKLPADHPEILRLLEWQTDEKVRAIYKVFRDDPLIRWKDSYKQAIGLDRPHEAGLDT